MISLIFVTVGTHEQQFDRLIETIDRLVEEDVIKEKVIMQIGYSDYYPKNCEYKKFYPYIDIEKMVKNARIVITHGGPSSFMLPLSLGKTPIVVPRQKKYNEHVNDHQMEFAKQVKNRMNAVLVVDDIDKLKETILRYDDIVLDMKKNVESNNIHFNIALEKMVSDMMIK